MVDEDTLPSDGIVDVFAVHTRFNYIEHRKLLHSDTTYVTILRDPVMLYESLYNYYQMNRVYRKSLEMFLGMPLKVFIINFGLHTDLNILSACTLYFGVKCL